jgi:hypothetical protein
MNFRMFKGFKSERILTAILLLFRISVLLFSVLLTLRADGLLGSLKDIILFTFCIYHFTALCFFWPVMNIGLTRLLFCSADLLIAQAIIFMTGGIYSPFIPCIFIPVFTLHFIYKVKGLAFGLLGCLVSGGGILLVSKGNLPIMLPDMMSLGTSMAVIAISMVLFYITPYFALKQFYFNSYRLRTMEEKYDDLNDMNSKLLILYEMTGRFNFENGIGQVMDRFLTICNELFKAERISIFLIRHGEVEVYGQTTPEEKENIYSQIMAQQKGGLQDEGREYYFESNTLMIPLMRGSRTDGILSIYGWDQQKISNKEAILFTMIANMICTYLENLEYVDYLQSRNIPETSKIINHLESGKAVKGILDKRIL